MCASVAGASLATVSQVMSNVQTVCLTVKYLCTSDRMPFRASVYFEFLFRLRCHNIILLDYHITMLLYLHIIISVYYLIFILPHFHVIILLYHHITILSCYRTVILAYYHIIIFSYDHLISYYNMIILY